MSIITKAVTKHSPTRVVCVVCGKPMTAQNERERDLMNRFPRDGFWMHEECQTPVQPRRERR